MLRSIGKQSGESVESIARPRCTFQGDRIQRFSAINTIARLVNSRNFTAHISHGCMQIACVL